MNTAPLTYETINSNTIINGDYLHIMPKISTGSVDFILTDPPYITQYQDRSKRSIRNDDNAVWLKPAFAEMYRVLARNSFCISFYGWPQADRFMNAFRAEGSALSGIWYFRSATLRLPSIYATSMNARICWRSATRKSQLTPSRT